VATVLEIDDSSTDTAETFLPGDFRPFDRPRFGTLPIDRTLRLLGATNVRLSLFTFESLPGRMSPARLREIVGRVVDDDGVAFELEDGRVGALVYGWRPPGAPDSWVEDRTIDRVVWALGGPDSSHDLIELYASHRWSAELSDAADIGAALAFAAPVAKRARLAAYA
jgi:hypothetical protein